MPFELGTVASYIGTPGLSDIYELWNSFAGEGLESSGPSPVPSSLAKEFDDLMNAGAPDVSDPSRIGASDGTQSTSGTLSEIPDAVTDIPSGPVGLPSPEELYGLQFSLGMMKVGFESLSNGTRAMEQNVDALLRAQA